MEEKIIYINVIFEKEYDSYSIILKNGIKNIAIVLTHNTGKMIINSFNYLKKEGDLIPIEINKDYMPGIIKISS